MWTSTALLALLALLAVTAATSLPDQSSRYFQADKEYLQRQRQILQFFARPQHPEIFQDFEEIAARYRLEEKIDNYEDSFYVKEFVKYQKAGLLFPRDAIYNQFSKQGVKEVQFMFNLLYFAKSFEAFIETAVYLREHVNLGAFYDAFATALEAREDTRDFYFPPLYEVYPYMFVDYRVVEQALDAAITAYQTENFDKIVIYSNHTGYWDADLDPENRLRYFTEEIGLNVFNSEWNRRYPAWWNSSLYPAVTHDRRGELFLYRLRQQLARYYLERNSNNLGEIPPFSFSSPLPGYFPRLRFADGQEVTARQPYTIPRSTPEVSIEDIKYYLSNLWRALDTGYIYDFNGTKIPIDYNRAEEILANLVYFTEDNPNPDLYGSLLRDLFHLLGHAADPEGKFGLAPSALMRAETAARDPLYYIIINSFFKEFYYKYLEKLPKHTKSSVYVKGLEIEEVDVDPLYTFFDDYDINLRNVHSLSYKRGEKNIDIYMRLKRLNHKHFTYKAFINSEKDMDVVVKVYITPKYDSQDRLLPINRRAFYAFEIDRFITKVPAGKSTIERHCDDSTVAVKDPPRFFEMWAKVKAAMEDKEPLKLDKFARPYGFPQRLLLPKGWRGGMPVQFVVAIYPYEQADITDRTAYTLPSFNVLGASYGVKFPDPRPIAYPADRLFRGEYESRVPNIFTKEVRIYQKTQEEINTVPDDHHE